MAVYICDAMMGRGKTQAAINFMMCTGSGEAPTRRFIYVTPYEDEYKRIMDDCPECHFATPAERPSKLVNIIKLLRAGRNIASTHQLFASYTSEIVDLIKEHHYTLIMDEAFEVIAPMEKITPSDVKDLLQRNIIAMEPDTYRVRWLDPDYDGDTFRDMMLRAQSGTLLYYNDHFLFWMFPIEVFNAFDDAIVMTYLFDAQNQRYYFELNNVEYDYIGVRYTGEDHVYEFCKLKDETPAQAPLNDLITVIDKPKLNAIGGKHIKDALKDSTLSASYFAKHIRDMKMWDLIGRNIYNVFHNYCGAKAGSTMWGILKEYSDRIDTRRYNNDFVACTLRATNKYRDRTRLAYVRNIYMLPYLARYYRENGCEVDEDRYALAELVQWIWRSAIRDGKPITVYLPSQRMRLLFRRWMDDISHGREVRHMRRAADDGATSNIERILQITT